jgi:hypothetical protein
MMRKKVFGAVTLVAFSVVPFDFVQLFLCQAALVAVAIAVSCHLSMPVAAYSSAKLWRYTVTRVSRCSAEDVPPYSY